ncbi:MAG: discoidin domain-containing protein [Azospirillaceae bacterium]
MILFIGPKGEAGAQDGPDLSVPAFTLSPDIEGVSSEFGFQFITLTVRLSNRGTQPFANVALGSQSYLLEDGVFPYFAAERVGPVDQSAYFEPLTIAPQSGIEVHLVFEVPADVGTLDLIYEANGLRLEAPVTARSETVADATGSSTPPEQPTSATDPQPEPEPLPEPESGPEPLPEPEPGPEPVPQPQPDPRPEPAPTATSDLDTTVQADTRPPLDAVPDDSDPSPESASSARSPIALEADRGVYLPGETIVVTFGGLPGNDQDWLTIVSSGAPPGTIGPFAFTNGRSEGQLELIAPPSFGPHEIRVMFDFPVGGNEIRATMPVSIEQPEPPPPAFSGSIALQQTTVEPGARMLVLFDGAADLAADAWIGIVPADTPHGQEAVNDRANLGLAYLNGVESGQVRLIAPVEPGDYDLRLHDTDQDGREIASIGFIITGPGADVTEPEAHDTAPEPDPEPEENPEPVSVPDVAVQPLLDVDSERVDAGAVIMVQFRLPSENAEGARILIAPSSTPANPPSRDTSALFSVPLPGTPEGLVEITAPDVGGVFDLHLVGDDGRTLVTTPFEVAAPPPPDISLEVDREVYRPGRPIVVTFDGLPGHAEEWVTLIDAVAPDSAYGQYFYTEGDASGTLTFDAPQEPGQYEIRVLLQTDGDRVVARLPVSVEGWPEPAIPQNLPGVALAHGVFEPGDVMLIGVNVPPDYPDDAWVGLLPADAPRGSQAINDQFDLDHVNLGDVRAGIVRLTAPQTPGSYDLRLHDANAANALEVASIPFSVSLDGTVIEPSSPLSDDLVPPVNPVNVASALFGAQAYTATNAAALIDGLVTDIGEGIPVASAPMDMPVVVALQQPYEIDRLHLLLAGGEETTYSYRIDGSASGETWETIVNLSDGTTAGWQEHDIAPTALRYIRIIGTGREPDGSFQAVELEVYTQDPVPFTALARRVEQSDIPQERNLAQALFGGSVRSSTPGRAADEALNDSLLANASWAANDGALPLAFTTSFNGGATATVQAMALHLPDDASTARPRMVGLEVSADDQGDSWQEIGVFGIHDRPGWHRMDFEPVDARRLRINVTGAHDEGLPLGIQEIAVIEADAEGHQSIIPGRYDGFIGGLNLAASALGGQLEYMSVDPNFDPNDMIDGSVGPHLDFDRQQVEFQWYSVDAEMPVDIVVSFRDGQEAHVGAVALNPNAAFNDDFTNDMQVQAFEIWVSTTSSTEGFERVGGFILEPTLNWQIFSFEPVPARFVRLRILSNYGGDRVGLGEFEVLEASDPGRPSILADSPPNLALLQLGGHYPDPTGVNRLALIDGRLSAPFWMSESGAQPPIDIVLAFAEQRLATIDAVTIAPSVDDPGSQVTQVRVGYSATSPAGPFETVGLFSLNPDQGPQRFDFEPVEARYVQIRVLENRGGAQFALAEIEIHERLQQGILSAAARRPNEDLDSLDDGDDPDLPVDDEPNDVLMDATSLSPGAAVDAIISPPTDADLYRIDTTDQSYPGITVEIVETPVIRVGLELLNSEGEPIADQPVFESAGDRALFSWAVPQGIYFLRVSRPLTSIVVQSDLSPSTDNVRAEITQALNAFVEETTEFERVAIGGFCGDLHLATDFTDDQGALSQAVDQINFGCGGTSLYEAMLSSLDMLEGEEGSKAILVVTDGEDTSDPQSLGPVLDRLSDAGVRVYAIGYGYAIYQQLQEVGLTGGDVLRTWSAATGGTYFDAPSGDRINVVTEQIAHELRRPSVYRLTVTTPQGEGGLSVREIGERIEGVSAPARVLLILDASNSMNGYAEPGRTKIAVARDVLRAVINGMPDGVEVGLRVYGHRVPRQPREQSCLDTEQVVPFATLDRTRLISAIDAIAPQGQTPIGLSLAYLIEDLDIPVPADGKDEPDGATSQSHTVVILVTDGIETCDPDPGDEFYPPQVVETLTSAGLDFRVNVVGFDIAESGTREFLRQISDLSGGAYFDAANADQLRQSLEDAMRAAFVVRDARGVDVATAQVNDPPFPLVEGFYSVEVDADPPIVVEVPIAVDEESQVLLNREGNTVRVEIASAPFDPNVDGGSDDPSASSNASLPPDIASLSGRDLIAAVQFELAERGFYTGSVDGISGPATEAAVLAYQDAAGLLRTGLPDQMLLADLRQRPTLESDTTQDGQSGQTGDTDGNGSGPPGVDLYDQPLIRYAAWRATPVHSGPGDGFEIIGTIPYDAAVSVLGETAGWYYIDHAGLSGFASQTLLTPTR